MDLGVAVVAVACQGLVAIEVGVEVVASVAVLIHPVVPDLLGPGVHEGVGVVAVPSPLRGHPGREADLHGRGVIAPAILVEVGQGLHHVHGLLVHQAVAVLVDGVAVLGGAGVDLGVGIVAVAPDGHRARGLSAAVGGEGLAAVAVPVAVDVPEGVDAGGVCSRLGWLGGGAGQGGDEGEEHGAYKVRTQGSPGWGPPSVTLHGEAPLSVHLHRLSPPAPAPASWGTLP